jgi:hypothetical protein
VYTCVCVCFTGTLQLRKGNNLFGLLCVCVCVCVCVCIQTGYNLVVCAYALGDREGMKEAFLRLLTVKSLEEDEEDDTNLSGLLDRDAEEDMRHVSVCVCVCDVIV